MKKNNIVLALSLLLFIGYGCNKDLTPDPDVNNDDVDQLVLGLPPVQFEPESTAVIDSTGTEQDIEYDYTIDYYTAAAGYDEQIVLNPATDVIYPGALIKGESILDGSYVPISIGRKPVTISTSLTGADSVSVVVENPSSLASVREAINDLMNQEYDVPPANLGFTIESVYSREHLKLALQASYDNGFTEVSGSFDYSNTTIKSRFVAKFIQSYYTLDIDLPSSPSDLISEVGNSNMYGSLMPMYISTVTFGRMALFTIESEYSETEVKAFLQASYASASGNSSTDFDQLNAKSTMKVYVQGGSGKLASTAINGFSDFKNYITEGGNFSKESPGAPISYKLRYIHDNTIARVVFAASYPIRTAIPRTDNIRYDVSVRLVSMYPRTEDGDGSANEFYGNIASWVSAANPLAHWNIARSGTQLSLAEFTTHNFPNNTTTNRTYTNLTGDTEITISTNVYDADFPYFPVYDDDDYLGYATYKINLIDVIGSAPAPFMYKIDNYGQGSDFMDLVFELKLEAIRRL